MMRFVCYGLVDLLLSFLFVVLLFSGTTSPAEIISLAACSTLISSIVTSFFGTNSKNPEVGLGVVGRNTLTLSPFSFLILFLTSPIVSVVMNASAQIPFLGYSMSTTVLKWFASSRNAVWNICLRAEYMFRTTGILASISSPQATIDLPIRLAVRNPTSVMVTRAIITPSPGILNGIYWSGLYVSGMYGITHESIHRVIFHIRYIVMSSGAHITNPVRK